MGKIPKKIHYCWFGNGSKNELMQKCIISWKKYFPEYEIIEWNESNFDIHQNIYVEQAYNSKKYAFVSDYARLKIVYENGGIYFDVDIEVIKNFEDILKNGAYVACEDIGIINTGLGFAAEPHNIFVKKMLDQYDNSQFIVNNEMDLTPCTKRNSLVFINNNWNMKDEIFKYNEITIYPTEYFCPYNYKTGQLKITDNTYSIHHCNGSWLDSIEKKLFEDKKVLTKRFGRVFGLIFYYVEKFFILLLKNPKEIIKKIRKRLG